MKNKDGKDFKSLQYFKYVVLLSVAIVAESKPGNASQMDIGHYLSD